MAAKIKIRRGTSLQWGASTLALSQGELGLDTTLNKLKVGNGSSLWADLPFFHVNETQLTTQAGTTLTAANLYTDTAVTSLGNTSSTTYVPLSDVGNADGVASLGPDGKIPDSEIPDSIARDSEIPSLTGYATETYVGIAISNLVDTAPETLNTLNELAAALGDDASFATTVASSISLKAPIASPTFTGTVGGIDKTMIGLNNVDNTTDALKPVSTATQTALDLKASLASPTFTGTVSGVTKTMVGLGSADDTADTAKPVSTATQTALNLKANLASPTFTGTVGGITKSMVGLANVDNTTDTNKPVSTAQATAIATAKAEAIANATSQVNALITGAPAAMDTLDELASALGDDANFAATVTTALGNKAPLASPTFTGTVGGITKSMVGLGSVDNTTDANKPVSTATQTTLDLKLNLSDPSVDYYITNSGSGTYLVNGISNGLITFEKGKKYRIVINASGHPFWIQTVSGAYSLGNVYSTGITNGGAQVGSILVELPQNAPDNLYYACEYHSSMQGSVSVQSDNTITTNAQASNYTISAIDSNRLIEMSGGGTLTITDSSLFPVGFSVDVLQTGASQVTIAGTSFTPNATPGLKLRTQWSSATLIKRALNSWVVLGDLAL